MECGYNLRTCPKEGVCPECAYPVQKSLDARPLAHADPAWRKRVQLGFVLLFIGYSIFFTVTWFGWTRITWWLGLWETVGLYWALLLLPTAEFLRRPETPADRSHWPVRFLPWVILVHLVLTAISAAMEGARLLQIRDATSLNWADSWIAIHLFLATLVPHFMVVEWWLVFRTMETLSGRIPCKPMMTEIRLLRWVFLLATVFVLIADLAIVIGRLVNLHAPMMPGSSVMGTWNRIVEVIAMIGHFGRLPIFYYLPIHLLRFLIQLRRGSRFSFE